MGAPLNFSGVQWEATRRKVDPAIRRIVDSLEVAYYKHWKLGESYPWHSFDKLATPAQSKVQFDILHGALWHLHALLLVEKDEGDVDRTRLDSVAAAARSFIRGLPKAQRDRLVEAVRAEGFALQDFT